MKIEGKLFAWGCAFYLLIALVYGVWSKDETGIVLLIFTGALAFLIAFFVLHTSKRVYPRPEDRKDAVQSDADIDYGFYSPHSWWPLPVAACAAIVAFGFVYAAWIVVAGAALLILSLIGFVFEYYRGDYSH